MTKFILKTKWGLCLNDNLKKVKLFNLVRDYVKILNQLKILDKHIFEHLNS